MFVARRDPPHAPVISVSLDDFVIEDEGDVGYSLTRAQEIDLPGSLKLSFVDAYASYETSSATARRAIRTSERVASAQVAAVLESNMAQKLAQNLLQQAWAARETAQIKLSPSKLAIDPGDCLSLEIDGVTRVMRVKTINTGLSRTLDLFGFDPALARGQGGSSASPRSAPSAKTYGAPIVEFMDIPLLSADDPKPWAPRIAAYASPWGGVSIYRASGGGFQLIGQVAKTAALGELTAPLYSGPRSVWDLGNAVYLRLYEPSVQMLSLTEQQTLSGLGAFAVKNPAIGEWEILQYVNATLPQTLRYGPSVYPNSDPSYAQADFVFNGVGLRPWSVTHIGGRRASPSSDVIFTWARRTRFGGDNWDSPPEVPLNEESESYDLEILSGANIVRAIHGLSSPSFAYSAAMQIADFGAPQASYAIRVYQLSAASGRGQAAHETVYL